jgi:hypothetical protein
MLNSDMSTRKEEKHLFEDDSSDGEELDVSFKKRARDVANMTITKANNANLKSLKEFLMDQTIITKAGDPDSNIIDRCSDETSSRSGRCYKISDPKKISNLMAHLEIARRDKLNMMFYEKQLKFSGIMDDFDIPQNGKTSNINSGTYHRYCQEKVTQLTKYLNFKEMKSIKIIIAFTKKHTPVFKKEKGLYYDGFHALIPGIQITRQCKRFINSRFIDESVGAIFQDFTIPEGKDVRDFFDINSAHVGVHFLGCKTQVGKKAYTLDAVYEVLVDLSSNSTLVVDCTKKFNDTKVNLVYELSLNWMRAKKYRVIEKVPYSIKDEFSKYLSDTKEVSETEDCPNLYGKLSTLSITDHESITIKEYLDILNSERSSSYTEWWEIMCILANTSPSYKALAHYFSSKSQKHVASTGFDEMFEAKWAEALRSKTKSTIGSLCFLAKLDNPEAFALVSGKSLFTIVNRMIYSPSASGHLGHFDLAIILEHMLKHKYVNAVQSGHSRSTWFEFITPEDPMVKGEVFKWRSYDGRKPPSMSRFVSEKVTVLLENIVTNISESIATAEDEGLKNAHLAIKKNLIKTIQSLKNVPTVRFVLEAAENIFEKHSVGFCSKLDSNPTIMGVGNGLLDLSTKIPKHVTGFSGHAVSKYTPVDYKPFNPYDPKTKDMLEALHNLFPDDEGDTFEWVMSYYASTLDNTPKESIFLAIVGGGSNGKSFINELHRAVLGDMYSTSMNPSFLLSTKFAKGSGAPAPDLLALDGINWVHFSETNMIAVLDSAKLKRITGGDSISGRLLYQNIIRNFKAKCHMTMTSNHDFDIEGNDHGIWRRIIYLIFKMRMIEIWKGETYDPEDKYTRIANAKVGKEWISDSEYLSAYLSILTYYYYRLHTKYGGKTMSVPHPNIERDTEEFRNRQDKINEFICTYLVKISDEKSELSEYEEAPVQSLVDIMGLYKIWFEKTYPGKVNKFTHLLSEFKNSKLSDILCRSRKGEFITGYRMLSMNEEPDPNESYVHELETKARTHESVTETFKEYHSRLCKDYDELQKSGVVFLENPEKKLVIQEFERDHDNDINIDEFKNNIPRSSSLASLNEKRRNKSNVVEGTNVDLDNYSSNTGLYQAELITESKTLDDDYAELFG